MGTSFLCNGYLIIRDLVDEYNLSTVVATCCNSGNGSWIATYSNVLSFCHSFSSHSMQGFVTSSIMDGLKQMNYGALVCLQNRTEDERCFDKGCKAVQQTPWESPRKVGILLNSQFRLDWMRVFYKRSTWDSHNSWRTTICTHSVASWCLLHRVMASHPLWWSTSKRVTGAT